MKKYVLPYGQGSKEIELDETLVFVPKNSSR